MLALPETLTAHEARAVLQALTDGLQREPPGAVTVDASALKRFDSSALAVLLACHRVARSLGRSLTLGAAPPKLEALAALHGVAELTGTPPGRAQAASSSAAMSA